MTKFIRARAARCCSIVVFISTLLLSLAAWSGTNGTIAVLGSSVAKGYTGGGSIIDGSFANGYAGLLTTYLDPLDWAVTNLSVGGDSTADVLARFDADVLPADPDLVQIGLSMSNEGLAGASDPAAVCETFRSGMTNIIAQIRSNGMYAMAGLCYPHNGYSATEYQYLKDMNILMNSWDLPSYNFLGAVDDGSGHWVEGYNADNVHPNAAGHQEMFYTIVPSLFDAIRLGKTGTPASIADAEDYVVISRDEDVQDPISYTPDTTVHSFTTSFRVRSSSTGTVAAVLQSGGTTLGDNRILVDFGPSNDDDGCAAPSPDSRGNYWNNWRPAVGDAYITVGTTLPNLITVDDGSSTPIGLEITAEFQSNGIKNGGLGSPDYALLGDFAVTNATEDYFHKANGTGSFKITGLDAGVQYTLRMFASRMQTDTRVTRYTATAANGTFSVNLQTTGTDIGADGYDGNNNTIVQLAGLEADSNGEIELGVSNAVGSFGYIGIMEISETQVESLEIGDSMLVDFGPSNDDDGRATSSRNIEDLYWNNWRPAVGGATVPVGASLDNLVKTSGVCTAVGLEVTTAFNNNGRVSGGLLSPSSSLLGYFAEPYATEDYFFSGGTSRFKITGLDPQFDYTLRFFGTRNTTSTRITKYTVNAGNGTYSTNLVTSGTAIGDGGYNGNNNIIPELNNLACDVDGEMIVNVSVVSGGYAYLGIMEIVVEGTKSLPQLALNDRFLVDFGTSNDDDGRAAPSPDQNGNYWNNWRPLPGSTAIPAGTTISGLTTTSNDVPTGVGLKVTSAFTGSNGRINGGLLAPDPALLGDFAVTNATEDYFYEDGATDSEAGFKIMGLDTQFTYDLRFFATRQNTSTRRTRYTVTGANGKFVTDLQTSGTDIGTGGYDGNNDTIVGVNGVIPDENGEIAVDLSILNELAYIGILELTVSGTASSTSSVGRILVDFGPDNDSHGHATASPDAEFGNYWNSWRPTDNQVSVSSGTTLRNLVRSDNGVPTYVSLEMTSAMIPTGIQNGGLTAPSAALLGDFAVSTATEDYFYNSSGGAFKVRGLNPDGVYTLRFFGTRATSEIRETRYTVSAGNGTYSVDLVTSGSGVGTGGYSGNNDTIAELTGLVPDSDGELSVNVAKIQGGYCHIGILEINETGTISGTGTGYGTVELRDDSVVYVTSSGHEVAAPVDATDNEWHDIALAHCYARQQTLLFVDGVQAGGAVEQIVPVSFVLGGEGVAFTNRMAGPLEAQYQDWCVYRSAWNEDEAAAQAAGNLQQASMEICAPLSDISFNQGEPVENRAQSLSEAVVNSASVKAKPVGLLIILQ